MNIQQVSNSAREIATKLGISKFDLSGSTVDETSVQVDKGEQKQVKASLLQFLAQARHISLALGEQNQDVQTCLVG